MIDLLQALLDNIVCYFQKALTLFANTILAGIGALWGAIVALLPDMPAFPSVPSYVGEAISFMYYITDIGWLLTYITVFGGLFITLVMIRIPLRWAKGAEE